MFCMICNISLSFPLSYLMAQFHQNMLKISRKSTHGRNDFWFSSTRENLLTLNHSLSEYPDILRFFTYCYLDKLCFFSHQVVWTQPPSVVCSTSPTLTVWAPLRWNRSSSWLTVSSWWLRWRRSLRRERPSMAWSPPRSKLDRQPMIEWLSVFVFFYMEKKNERVALLWSYFTGFGQLATSCLLLPIKKTLHFSPSFLTSVNLTHLFFFPSLLWFLFIISCHSIHLSRIFSVTSWDQSIHSLVVAMYTLKETFFFWL